MNISVVIPVYNREKYIKKCIQSILEQTYQPMEIIVVDDGSTDGTIDKIKEIDSKIVRVVSGGGNHGAQNARNIGISEARGDWIAFLDSDDMWLPGKLEKQKDCVEKSGRPVCAGGGLILRNGKQTASWLDGQSGMVFEQVILHKMCFLYPTILVKKDCLLQIGMLDEKVPAYQELDVSIGLASHYEVDYINEPLFIWNCDNKNTISNDKKKQIAGREYLFTKYRNLIKDTHGNRGISHWYRLLRVKCPALSIRWWKYLMLAFVYDLL